ncbi:MAG: ergothioneine biosynthesis protein EgtB [Acidobacteriota bacterium]
MISDLAHSAPLTDRFLAVRRQTEDLAAPLATEDYVVQSMPDVSPTKWHLAHVTWFFETFVLVPQAVGYEVVDPDYQFLFNSYYLGAGERHCRDQRGYLSRPTVEQVYTYRQRVDEAMAAFLDSLAGRHDSEAQEIHRVVEIGLHHEQQHQELLLTDIKHVLSVNPLRPAYDTSPRPATPAGSVEALRWLPYEAGLREIGHRPEDGFSFDNEGPRHRYFLEPFELADRLVTQGEFLEFLTDGGYRRGDLWLSEGWAQVQEAGWKAPFYWQERDGEWQVFTLHGLRPLEPSLPLAHISYFEADAYARWAGARLPSEFEWEAAAATLPRSGNFVESRALHPLPAADDGIAGPRQMFGDVWEWTASQYSPYPGYRPLDGTLGEYNGKFMSNKFVLRGGSCVTPGNHIRATYRNFFPADTCWQFSGLRLAR